MGIYPFMFAARKDFEPVVESITKVNYQRVSGSRVYR